MEFHCILLCIVKHSQGIILLRDKGEVNAIYKIILLVLQHRLGEVSDCLSDTEIPQDLLSSAQDSIELVRAVEDLDMLAHSGLRQGTSSPDLDRLVGNFVSGARRTHLEETDGTRKMFGLLGVGHMAHLEGDALEPSLVGFDKRNHLSEPAEMQR